MSLANKRTFLVRCGRSTILISYLLTAGCLSNLHDEQLHELRTLQANLPIHPSFAAVKTSEVSKINLASISTLYRSPASYEDVKSFYKERLMQQGWQLVGEREMREWGHSYGGYSLDFSRGEYRVTIQYAGKRDQPNSWDYGVSVGWG